MIFADASTGEINIAGSAPGTYVITYTTAGTCPGTSTQTFTITNTPNAAFTYAATSYCTSGANPTPVVTGSLGVFSATPMGLIFNPSTGVVNLATSIPGTYDVTNTIAASGTCAATSETVQITITATEEATFSYASTTYCLNGTNPTPIVTGTTGLFSSTLGLSIDANTGEINLANSVPGTYTVTNELPASGACPAVSATTVVTVTASPDAAFTYAAITYCSTGTASPIVTGTTGTFTATPFGLSLDASTGVIDLTSSIPGTYTVTNELAAAGACPAVSATTVVTVTASPDAAFTYAAITYCSTGTASPIVTGTTGTFTATPLGLSLDASTGVIDLASSNPGTYTVTNTIAAAASCDEVSATFQVTVEAQPTATVTLTGNTLSAQETGVTYQWINCSGNIPVTGETAQTFTPSASGSYAVIITNGTCSATSACHTVSSAELEENSMDLIAIYPNPAAHTITISGLTTSNATVSILDVKGRVLISEMTSSATITLPVHQLETGVYLINVNSNTIRGTKRFIKK